MHEQSQVDVPMSVHDVDRIFCMGDGVEVIGGELQGANWHGYWRRRRMSDHLDHFLRRK